jgi:Ca2+-binding RTX toxin-like protein
LRTIYSSSSISSAGDINGDGIDDIIVGASGKGYVIFGSKNGFAANFDLTTLDGTNGFTLPGTGGAVSNAGDLNGDGIDDVIIGAPGTSSRGLGEPYIGQSYIIFGTVASEFIGTKNDDILTGDKNDNFISGKSGNDTLSGLNGRDEILGGRGNDQLSGGKDDDLLNGQTGKDTISGNDDNDRIFGKSGNDELLGNQGNDTIEGGIGRDRIVGNIDADSLEGNGASDAIEGNNGNDLLQGNSGNDTLIGGNGNDNLNGGSGDDVLIGVNSTHKANSILGRKERDTLTGGRNKDIFVLADVEQVFYDDGDNLSIGEGDLAIITDLNADKDKIQLQGSVELYNLDFFTSSSGLINVKVIYDLGITAVGETIALIKDVNLNLSLEDTTFTFV